MVSLEMSLFLADAVGVFLNLSRDGGGKVGNLFLVFHFSPNIDAWTRFLVRELYRNYATWQNQQCIEGRWVGGQRPGNSEETPV